MCGLLGWHVEPEQAGTMEHAIMVAMLARSMDTRGGHSHGVWTGDKLIKGLGDLVTSDHVSMSDLARLPFCIGHTRFATIGARTVENAHPWIFTHGDRMIIGAHNGQVSNHYLLNHRRKAAELPEVSVDSMHIFEHIIRGQSLKEIEAYGAIVYAEPDRTVRLGRFNDGEMTVLITAHGLYWASTDTSLKYAAWAAGIPVVKLQTLKANRLYRITADGVITKDGPLQFGKYDHWDWKDWDKQIEARYGPSTPTTTTLPLTKGQSCKLDTVNGKPCLVYANGKTVPLQESKDRELVTTVEDFDPDDYVYEEEEDSDTVEARGNAEIEEDGDGYTCTCDLDRTCDGCVSYAHRHGMGDDLASLSADARAAYAEYQANERAGQDDTDLVGSWKARKRGSRRRLRAISEVR